MRDLDHSYLNTAETKDDAARDLRGRSISYRIALGPHEGRNAFTLQTLPAMAEAHAGAVANPGLPPLPPPPPAETRSGASPNHRFPPPRGPPHHR